MKRLALFSIVLLSVSPLEAEIYKYRDAQGGVHFSDKPITKSRLRLEWRSAKYDWPTTGSKSKKSSLKAGIRRSKWNPKAFRKRRAKFSPMISAAAKKVKLRPELLHAVVQVESGYNPTAVSKAGATGLMQLMPGTAERFGVANAKDPEQNIDGGARYLRELLELFSFDLKLALAGYNAGENAVIKYGNTIPPYPETQRYVKKVLKVYMQRRIETATQGMTASLTN